MNELEHDWCNQQMAAYLAGGLGDEERCRFEAHAGECDACTRELDELRGIESHMTGLFAPVMPAGDFEDRMISRFRTSKTRRRMKVHPIVRKVALAAAAAIVVGAVGYMSENLVRDGKLISSDEIAANLERITTSVDGSSKSYSVVAASPPRSPATRPFSASYDEQDAILLPTDDAPSRQNREWASVRRPNQSTAQEEVRKTVSDLMSQSNQLTASGKYGEALGVLDHVLTLDPNNDYAKNARPLIEDRAVIANQRSSRERFDRGESRQFFNDVPSNTPAGWTMQPGARATAGGISGKVLGVSGSNGYGVNVGTLSLRDGVVYGSVNHGALGTGKGYEQISSLQTSVPSNVAGSLLQADKKEVTGLGDITVDSYGTNVAVGGAARLNGIASAGAGTVSSLTSGNWGKDSGLIVDSSAGGAGSLNIYVFGGRETETRGSIKVVPVKGAVNTEEVVNLSTAAPATTNGILPGYISTRGFASVSSNHVVNFGSSKELTDLTTAGNAPGDIAQRGGGILPNSGVTMGGTTLTTGQVPALVAGNQTGGSVNGQRRQQQSQQRASDIAEPPKLEAESFQPQKYTIAGGGTVTPNLGITAPISVVQGNQPISGPVKDLRSSFTGGTTVQSGTIINANNQGITKLGAGTANFTRLNVPNGTLSMGDGPAKMSFTGGATVSGGEWVKDDSSNSKTVPNSVTFGTFITRPATQPVVTSLPMATPIIGDDGQPTTIVQAFIQQSDAPNPISQANARTSGALALANTQQQPAPAQPSQGGAAAAGQPQQPAQPQQVQQPPVQQQAPQPPPPPVIIRKVIRDGVMEFEVDSFDSSFAVVSKITAEEGGFVVAADSDRLQNGKVRGTITVRVPPDNLDTLILKLRALGELKSQRLGSKDISKEYTDLESELRAGRAMEERLLQLIKTSQGNVAQLLQAEKELGTTREKLEKIQGQMSYYNNLVAMATLTINAYEKDIRTPATATQSEEINAGIEAEDVDAARTAALKAIEEAKGRIIESTLQQMVAGQFAAKIVADVAPDQAGQVVDRLRQIGKVARLDSQRKQTTGTGPNQAAPAPSVQPKVEQAPTRLIISLYNLANVAPRLTTNLNLAGDDVETVYRNILKRVTDGGGRVVSSNLNRQDANQITGTIQFEVKTAEADAVLNDIRQPVQVLRMTETENPDTANVTNTKRGFTVQIIPTAQVTPRLTTNLNLAAADVESTYSSLLNRIRETGGRVIASNLNRQDATQAVGTIQFEVKTADADALMTELRKTVQVLTLNVNENTGAANLTSLKQGFSMQIIPAAQVNPREVRSMAVQTSAVDSAIQKVTQAAQAAGGRVVESSMTQDEGGGMIARVSLEVPLDKLESVSDVAKSQGKVRTAESSRNAQVPEGPLTRARINLTIGTGETIVPQTGGFWDTIRGGLSTSVKGLLWSLQLIIIGLCLIGPWVLLGWGGVKWMKRRKVKAGSTT